MSFSTGPLSVIINAAAWCDWRAVSAQVMAEVQALNERADIDGIVVQMPLPAGVNSDKVGQQYSPGRFIPQSTFPLYILLSVIKM